MLTLSNVEFDVRSSHMRRSITKKIINSTLYHVVDFITYHVVVTLLHITFLWREQSIRRFIAKKTINSTFYYISRCYDFTYHVVVILLHITLLWRNQLIKRFIILHFCDEINQLNVLLYFCQWLLKRFFDFVDLKNFFINTFVVNSTIRLFDMNIWFVVQLNCTNIKSKKKIQQSLIKKKFIAIFIENRYLHIFFYCVQFFDWD